MPLTPTDPAKAQIWIRGEAPNQIIDVYVPRGARGEIGPVGPQGPAVPTTMTVLETTTGPETPGATGPQGPVGAKGDPGGIVLGTPLGTGDLNSILTPGTYRQINSADATLVRNYPKANLSGLLNVYGRDANVVIQQYMTIDGTVGSPVMYQRLSTSPTTWTAWRTFATQRMDEAAGRAIYTWDDLNNREQLTYGDTGWRDVIASDGLPGATGYMRIRRTGHVVELSMSATLPDATVSNATLFNIPVGFRPGSPTAVNFYYSRTSAATGQITYGLRPTSVGLEHSAAWSASWGEARLRITWTTDNNWPTTLPGTAYGSIPNL